MELAIPLLGIRNSGITLGVANQPLLLRPFFDVKLVLDVNLFRTEQVVFDVILLTIESQN